MPAFSLQCVTFHGSVNAHLADIKEEIIMALKAHVIESQKREQRQLQYLSAPALSKAFPAAKEFVIELRFVDPERKVRPSPHKRIFTPEMQAFFEFPCPLRDCTGGGFSLGREIAGSLTGRRTEASGVQTCQGKRKREGSKDANCGCGLELHYQAILIRKSQAAA
jgi:hypothetical protein